MAQQEKLILDKNIKIEWAEKQKPVTENCYGFLGREAWQ